MRQYIPPFTVGLIACLSIACDETEPAEEPQSCPCACRALDPVAHCVNTQDCTTTADCPSGTVCAALPGGMTEGFPSASGSDPLAGCGSGTPSKRCQIPDGPAGRQTLIADFEVEAFGLLRLDSGGPYAAYTWNPPEETHVVHCALFACPPVIEETEVDGRPVFRIRNYEQCVIAAQLFEPGEGVFDVGDGSIAFAPDVSEPECGTVSPRTVHELMVGCWAYDTTKIIAATPLEPVSPAETFNYHQQFDLTCASSVDGRTCGLDESSLGTCGNGTCRPPCVTNRDCDEWETAPAPDAGADGGDAVDLVCMKGGGYVGVCLPVSETTEVGR